MARNLHSFQRFESVVNSSNIVFFVIVISANRVAFGWFKIIKSIVVLSSIRRSKEIKYFQYDGSIYEQKDGAAMGSPVSAVIANLYTESLEEQAITTSSYEPRIWKRYVDDTFTILDRENVDDFLQYLNNQQPSICFSFYCYSPRWITTAFFARLCTTSNRKQKLSSHLLKSLIFTHKMVTWNASLQNAQIRTEIKNFHAEKSFEIAFGEVMIVNRYQVACEFEKVFLPRKLITLCHTCEETKKSSFSISSSSLKFTIFLMLYTHIMPLTLQILVVCRTRVR